MYIPHGYTNNNQALLLPDFPGNVLLGIERVWTEC